MLKIKKEKIAIKGFDGEVFVLSKQDFVVELVISGSYFATFGENINYDGILDFANKNNISKVILLSYFCEFKRIK